ncbi:hypothetical protein P43SY_001546 [Pythium insidiosum]|uniref:Protein kinase domain-containing protein n=1 Tax=Pythium insidiosum TaxID=114742 RepID=A0AAD5LB50_PYTIN|nr:hypothetical protein P43SY_001546 [Pythium insidiosum]
MRACVLRLFAAAAAVAVGLAHAQPGYKAVLNRDCEKVTVTVEPTGNLTALCDGTGKSALDGAVQMLHKPRVEIRIRNDAPSAVVTIQTDKQVETISEVWIGCYENLPTPPRVAFGLPDTWAKFPNLSSLKMENTNAANVSMQLPGPNNGSWLNKIDFQGTRFSAVPALLYERVYAKLEVLNLDLNVSAGATQSLSATHYDNLETNMAVAKLNASVTLIEDCSTGATARKPVLVVCKNGKLPTPTKPSPSAPESPSDESSPEASTPQEYSSGSSAAAVVLVILAVLLVGAIGFVFFRRRQGKALAGHESPAEKDRRTFLARGQSLLANDTKLAPLLLDHKDLSLTKQLGQGQLWLGEYAGQSVVVSRVLTAKRDESATLALHAQAQVWAALAHANIVSLVGVAWVQDTDLGVVAEFMDHGSLQSVLLDEGIELTLRQRVRLCLGVANALAYLHAPSRQLHLRRLSSRKVLVNDALESKVSLFECARSAANDAPLPLPPPQRFGAGELAWMAPEQLEEASSWDPQRANIFSMGVLLSEALTRRVPYQDESGARGFTLADLALRQRIQLRQPLVPHENSAAFQALPPALQTLVQRCLSYDVSERPSADEIVEVLQASECMSE